LGPDGKPIDNSVIPGRSLPYKSDDPYVDKSDDPYLGFAESIDPQTNKIWIATRNKFHDVFSPDVTHPITCTSGVTVRQL
jgi:hypothetical protein